MSSREAQRESYNRCDETCPAVDRAIEPVRDMAHTGNGCDASDIDRMIETIKQIGTGKLRDALTECCEELLEERRKCEELQEKVKDLERQVEDLGYELKDVQQNHVY